MCTDSLRVVAGAMLNDSGVSLDGIRIRRNR